MRLKCIMIMCCVITLLPGCGCENDKRYTGLVNDIDHSSIVENDVSRIQSWSRNEDTIAAAIAASTDTVERHKLLLRLGIVTRSQSRLESIIKENPEPWVGGIAAYTLMGLYSRNGAYRKALTLYETAYENGWLYAAYAANDPEAQAIRTGLAMPDGMTEHEIAARVESLPIPYHFYLNDTATAITIYKGIISKYPETDRARESASDLRDVANGHCPYIARSRRNV